MASPLFVAQQVFSAMTSNSGASPQCSNGTTPNSSTTATAPFQFPTDIGSLISFLFGFSALREWLKLIVIGSLLETFRRIGFYLYYKAYSSLFITARFDEDDLPYSWLMFWLTQQDTFKNSARYVQVTSHSYGVSGESVLIDGEEKDPSQVVDGARPLAFLPAIDTSHTMWYRRHWMRVVRYVREGDYGRKEQTVEICICTFGYSILNELLLEAKKAYNIARENRISIFVSDSQNNWRLVSSRPKRSLKSIVLDPGVKDLLIQDASDFLQSKSWYSARGIPFRRGYLLYGAPGSGKTSIIHSLAGELGLNVYVISLSRFGLDDTALSSLIAELPEKCIALMEDIDAAFNQTLTREDNDDKSDDPQKKQQKQTVSAAPVIQTSRVSLSGLLNALDGVGAQEGRILFATTNKYHALDPALCRPGRMDLHIEFKLASKFQAGELFKCFYVPEEEEEQVQSAGQKSEKEENDSGYGSGSDVDEKSPLTPSSPPPSPPSTASSGLVFGSSHRTRCPKLSTEQVDTLAAEFASAVPEREFSMAALQGYLMSYKVRPFEAAKDIAAWIEKERQEKKRLEDMNKKKAENSPDTPPKPEDTSKSGEGEAKVAEPSKDSTTSAPVKVEESAASS